jgi:O-antigen ligase
MMSQNGYTTADAVARPSALGLALVIALNGLLIIRPEELYPSIDGLRLYYILFVCCLIFYAPPIGREFSAESLSRHPTFVFILGLLTIVVLSQLSHFEIGKALEEGQKFAKVAAYYLLLTVALTTLWALRVFLSALVLLLAVQTSLSLFQYHEFIDIEALRPLQQVQLENDGDVSVLARLRGSGIYHDPNDLCLLLVAGILICLDRAVGRGGSNRFLWSGLFALFVYALTLTHSRGGVLAVGAGLAAYLAGKYGTGRALRILILLAPLGLAVFAGRQTRIDMSDADDTSQQRVRAWSDGFKLIPSHPFFGIGAGQYPEECGMEAHNSFVHAYVELGPLGGGLFLAAFLIAVASVWATRPDPSLPPEDADELTRLRPVLLGLLASYMVGMFSLSRNYIPPTYLNLALATVYVRLAAPAGLDSFRFDRRMFAVVCGICVLGYVGLKLFIDSFVLF